MAAQVAEELKTVTYTTPSYGGMHKRTEKEKRKMTDLFECLHHPTAGQGVCVDYVRPVADAEHAPSVLQRHCVPDVRKLSVSNTSTR